MSYGIPFSLHRLVYKFHWILTEKEIPFASSSPSNIPGPNLKDIFLSINLSGVLNKT